CTKHMPQWNYVSISGYHIREAGSSAVQELAFTLADGFGHVELGIEAGLKVDDFAPRLSFFFNSTMDFFEEIAKFRAARRIWTTVIDPLGGSYMVEYLTDELENEAYKYFDRIERAGGIVEAIKSGYLQREIAENSYRLSKRVESGEDAIVGVNKYTAKEEPSLS